MTKYQLTDLGPKISDENILSFEQCIGNRLPKEYRGFLLETNGGQVPDEFGHYHIEDADWWVRVNFFYGLHRPDVPVYKLERVLKSRTENYPECFGLPFARLPIAADDFGNVFYIFLNGPNEGAIFYWMHGGDGTEDDFLNYSFNLFFESLTRQKD